MGGPGEFPVFGGDRCCRARALHMWEAGGLFLPGRGCWRLCVSRRVDAASSRATSASPSSGSALARREQWWSTGATGELDNRSGPIGARGCCRVRPRASLHTVLIACEFRATQMTGLAAAELVKSCHVKPPAFLYVCRSLARSPRPRQDGFVTSSLPVGGEPVISLVIQSSRSSSTTAKLLRGKQRGGKSCLKRVLDAGP